MRDHISEEMWLHLNLTHLDLAHLSFTSILGTGRSEFNRRVEMFAEAFHGLAADTMIRGESWSFLQLGKYIERASMICRILEIKRKTLTLSPEAAGAPVDVHQWQALLRSLSGYEPYRRAYDARIIPVRVLEFVIRRPDYPRSLTFAIAGVRSELQVVSGNSPAQIQLKRDVDLFLEELVRCDTTELIRNGSFEIELRRFERRCSVLTDALDLAYFASLRPHSVPSMAATAPPAVTLIPR
jgi:uncharacterized alpha-E superfamily protein